MRSNIVHRTAIPALLLLMSVAPTSAPCAARTLFGGVAHSEAVPPADTRYPIAKLSKEIPARERQNEVHPTAQPRGTLETPVVEWLQIPKWMAGKWNKKGDQTTSYTDFKTGLTTPTNEWTADDMTVTWGCQFDRLGNIWHAYFLPFERDAVSGGKFVKFVIVSLKRETNSSDQVVSRLHSIVTETAGGQVVDVYQQESLNDYVLLPSGQLENNSSNRDFTYAGRPTKEGALVSLFTKVGPFVPEATHNGIDMLKSLNEYLTTHNMSQLVRTGP
jgi:hypothetical protein